jgi:hypothetical protein
MAPCTGSRGSGLLPPREKFARFIAHLFASVCLVNNRTVYAARIHVFVVLILTLCFVHFVCARDSYVPLADLACKKPNEGRVSITGRQFNPTQPNPKPLLFFYTLFGRTS